jgi:hypothetical protein
VAYIAIVAAIALALALLLSLVAGCGQNVGRAAVTLSLQRGARTPRDAMVIIDEQYIGPLAYVAARGVRLPVGQHRITVQREGYFPWDRLVVSDRQPITLEVELVPIPD